MINNMQFKGKFWLPEYPDVQITGTLIYDKEKGVSLDLLGHLKHKSISSDRFQPKLINGFASSGEKLTLYKCSESQWSMNSPGIGTSKLSSQCLFVGALFKEEAEIKFNKMSVRLKGLDEWLGISSLEFNSDYAAKTAEIKYKVPDPINFTIPGFKAAFKFIPKYPNRSIYNKCFAIEQNVHVEFETKDGTNIIYNEYLSKLFTLQMFLTVATHSYVYPLEVNFNSSLLFEEFIDDLTFPDEIKMFTRNLVNHSEDEINYLDMLFHYDDIAGNYEEIVSKWYEDQENLAPILGLYLQEFNTSGIFDENRFINIAQALESFHRKFIRNEVLPKNKHEERLNKIYRTTPGEYLDWMKQKLNFSNEPSLKERIEELLKIYSNDELKKIIKEEDKFVRNLRDSRNFYTHYDSRLQNKALKGGDLFYLNERMKVLLICCLLERMKFDKVSIQNIINRNGYRLFNHLI